MITRKEFLKQPATLRLANFTGTITSINMEKTNRLLTIGCVIKEKLPPVNQYCQSKNKIIIMEQGYCTKHVVKTVKVQRADLLSYIDQKASVGSLVLVSAYEQAPNIKGENIYLIDDNNCYLFVGGNLRSLKYKLSNCLDRIQDKYLLNFAQDKVANDNKINDDDFGQGPKNDNYQRSFFQKKQMLNKRESSKSFAKKMSVRPTLNNNCAKQLGKSTPSLVELTTKDKTTSKLLTSCQEIFALNSSANISQTNERGYENV